MSIMETIRRRKSIRNYSDKPLEAEKLAEIEAYLKNEFIGVFGYKPWFRLLSMSDFDEKSRSTLGAYGFIRGAKLFIAGAVEQDDMAMLDYGYCLEKIILKLTEMGLGTCWLAGSFKKAEINDYFSSKLGMEKSQSVPAITPVGYQSDRPGFIDSAIKIVMKTDRRKPWSELFSIDGSGEVLTEQSAEKYAQALESVRLAPSANNGQPWRICKDSGENIFHFYTNGVYMLDIGIAMAHFEMTAAETGLSGAWVKQESRSAQNGMEYITSWVGR